MENKFNKLFNLIMEQLNSYQKYLTDKAITKRKYLDFGPIFKEERTYFPIDTLEVEDLKIPENIKFELDNAGYYITDYRAGIAMKKAKQGQQKDLRQIKIGKILNRLNKPELSKEFNERLGTSKKDIKNINFSICITHNPYDISGMSTGRNWTSCMELPNKFGAHGGAYHKTALRQVEYGGMCAYLINQNDKEIKQPYARIAIKRFVNNTDNTFLFFPETIIYGDNDLAEELHMNQKVIEILNISNKQTKQDTIHFKTADRKSYSDGGFDTFVDSDNLNKLDTTSLIAKMKNMYPEDIKRMMQNFQTAKIQIPLNIINTYINIVQENNVKFSIDIIKLLLKNQPYSNEMFNKILNICPQWDCYLIMRDFTVIYVAKHYKLTEEQIYQILEKAKPQIKIMKAESELNDINNTLNKLKQLHLI